MPLHSYECMSVRQYRNDPRKHGAVTQWRAKASLSLSSSQAHVVVASMCVCCGIGGFRHALPSIGSSGTIRRCNASPVKLTCTLKAAVHGFWLWYFCTRTLFKLRSAPRRCAPKYQSTEQSKFDWWIVVCSSITLCLSGELISE